MRRLGYEVDWFMVRALVRLVRKLLAYLALAQLALESRLASRSDSRWASYWVFHWAYSARTFGARSVSDQFDLDNQNLASK